MSFDKDVVTEIETCVPEGGDWCTVEKAMGLATLIVGLRPDIVVELGVWAGGSAIPMAIALRSIGRGKLVAIDAWSAHASVQGQDDPANAEWWGKTVGDPGHEKAYQTFISRLEKHHITGDRCAVQRMSSDQAPVLPSDLLHVDANHGPAAVADIERWAPHVRLGGILVMDDLGWAGGHVQRAHDRARQMGFVDLYPLGTGVVMQRVHDRHLVFTPAFSPRSRYLLRDIEEEVHFSRYGGAPESRLIDWAGAKFGDPKKTFVDVGAHVGTWAQHMAARFGHVHAFEPQRSTYDRLVDGARVAGIGNMTCACCALGSTPSREVDLSVLSADGGGSTLRPREELGTVLSVEKVRISKLDEFDLGLIGLIKIDAEGSELEILRGATETIAQNQPRLLVEAWKHDWYKEQRAELIGYIEKMGYRVRPVENWPEMLLCDPGT